MLWRLAACLRPDRASRLPSAKGFTKRPIQQVGFVAADPRILERQDLVA